MKNKPKKTILIPITRGFIIRNILRSGGYKLLKAAGFHVVVVMPLKEIPVSLKEEFSDEQIDILPIAEPPLGRWHRLFIKVVSFSICTKSTVRFLKYGNTRLIARHRLLTNLNIAVVYVWSRLGFLRPLWRKLEMFFDESTPEVHGLFDTYQPDIVFGTSLLSKYDIAFMKEARRRKIATVAMPKGWDGLTRTYFRFIPDQAVVQNELLRSAYASYQGGDLKDVHVVGFPQFDWYANTEIRRTRKDHLAQFGFDPDKKTILLGSEGAWSTEDFKIATKIHGWIQDGKLKEPAQILFRPHFSNIYDDRFKQLKNEAGFALDDTIIPSPYFVDNWDPSYDEITDLTNTLLHCDVLITTASTLNLDAVCFDKPLINLAFGGKFRGTQDITKFLYDAVHIDWLFGTGAVELAHNEDELLQLLNRALTEPDRLQNERKRLLSELCYKVDGSSSERLVQTLVSICEPGHPSV